LWIKAPDGVEISAFEGDPLEAVKAHPVADNENWNRFVFPRTRPDPALHRIGGFLEYGSMLREARAGARKSRDGLTKTDLQPGHVLYRRTS
jgi:hypothetical protein